MYQIGDKIIYGGEGVCLVEAIGPLSIPGSNRDKTYYTLAPFYRTGKIYTPVDTSVFMRPILTRQEAEALVRSIPDIQGAPCGNQNPRMLNNHYKDLLQTHECAVMVQLIKAVYCKRQEALARKGKSGQMDERYMRRAEELLYGELAAALELTPEQVPLYIKSVIEGGDAPA